MGYALFFCLCSLPTTVIYFSSLGQLDPILFFSLLFRSAGTLPFIFPTKCILVLSSISYQVL